MGLGDGCANVWIGTGGRLIHERVRARLPPVRGTPSDLSGRRRVSVAAADGRQVRGVPSSPLEGGGMPRCISRRNARRRRRGSPSRSRGPAPAGGRNARSGRRAPPRVGRSRRRGRGKDRAPCRPGVAGVSAQVKPRSFSRRSISRQDENRFFAHRIGAGLAPAHGALAVAGAALPGFAAAGHHEGRHRLGVGTVKEKAWNDGSAGGIDLGQTLLRATGLVLVAVVDAPRLRVST